MKKLVPAAFLAIVALFMLLGFLNSDAGGSGARIVTLLLVVGLPAIGSAALFRSHFQERDRLSGRKAQLRQQTVEAEIIRLAGDHGARLTAIEVSRHLTMTPEAAKEALDALAVRGQAEIEVTDAGLLVYHFYDVRHLGQKHSAKGLLDD
jgi:hypothetical protein